MERCNEKDHEVESLLTQIFNRTIFTNTPYQILTCETFRQFYTQDLKLHKNFLKNPKQLC